MRRTTTVSMSTAMALLLALGAAGALAQDATVPRPLRDAAVALQKGELDLAIQLYGEALNDKALSSDRKAVIHTDRGATYMRRGLLKQAIEDFNRAIQFSAEYAPAYNNRGNALIGIGAPKEAIKDFDRALLLSPSYAAAFANRAAAHLRLGATDQAIVDFSRAIEIAPTTVSAFNGRGLAHLAAERPYAAARDFTRAVDLDARFSAGYRNRAAAKSLIDRSEDVIEDLSRALTFDPRHIETHVLRAEAYLAVGNPAGALRDYSRVIELSPRSATAFAGRAVALARAEAFEDALADLAKAIEYDPRLSKAYAVRAWIYKQTQQLDLAQKDLERALKLEPVTADAVWAQGELEETRGRLDAATTAYTKALGIDARHRLTLDALSRLNLVATRPETEVAGSAMDRWRIMQSGDQFFAVTDQIAGLRVPLETLGKGQPKLLAWQRQPAPHAGFGVLRFSAGRMELTAGQPEELESAAIVDIGAPAVIAMPLFRKGAKTASLSWEDSKLVVTGADGVAEEIALRGVKPSAIAAAPTRPGGERRPQPGSTGQGPPAWAPWAQGPGPGPPQRQASRPPKQKSLFEMLFGN